MQNQMNRTLTILADGESVTGYARARLIGTERLGLSPVSHSDVLLLMMKWYKVLPR